MLALTIANEGQRLSLWQQAQTAVGHERGLVMNYLDAAQPEKLAEALSQLKTLAKQSNQQAYVRLESPGEDFNSIKMMIALGEETGHIAAKDAFQLTPELGRIVYPKQWYDGFVMLMKQCQVHFAAADVPVMNAPEDLIALFDKRITNRHLQGLTQLPDVLEQPTSFNELLDTMEQRRWAQVFVKLASGSSASGVIALRCARGHGRTDRVVAYTTMQLQDRGDDSFGVAGGEPPSIYNSLRIQRYDDIGDIEFLVDYLFAQGAQVQQWLPKAQHESQNYDMRVLVVGGEAAHSVVRLSRSPMTNLHLGNQRTDIEQLGLQPSELAAIYQEAENAARCFAGCHYLGVDVMLVGQHKRATVIECNGFGDLLPTTRFKNQTTHELELQMWQEGLAPQ